MVAKHNMHARTTTTWYVTLFLCVTLPHCCHRYHFIKQEVHLPYPKKKTHKTTITHQESTPSTITIWVHGTRFLRRYPFYHYFDGKPSLRLATSCDKEYSLRMIAELLYEQNPHQFCLNHFYLFGWSGKLSAQERADAAQALYEDLQKAIDEFRQQYNKDPQIVIIAHSHGGNLALNLAKVHQQHRAPFIVDALVLLACPVQESTMHLSKDPLFKKIYALHSSLDWVQIIAPQITYHVDDNDRGITKTHLKFPPFSQRYFPSAPHIAQVKLKMNGRAIMHQEFVDKKFLALLPSLIEIIDKWQQIMPYESETQRKLLCVRTSKKIETPQCRFLNHRFRHRPMQQVTA